MTIYGYARVSTDGQSLESQVAALTTAGARKVCSEKQSGAKNRPCCPSPRSSGTGERRFAYGDRGWPFGTRHPQAVRGDP
jgi:hypothetical protein